MYAMIDTPAYTIMDRYQKFPSILEYSLATYEPVRETDVYLFYIDWIRGYNAIVPPTRRIRRTLENELIEECVHFTWFKESSGWICALGSRY